VPRGSESRLRLLGRLEDRRPDAGLPKSSVDVDRASTILLGLTSGSGDGEGTEIGVCGDVEGILASDETELPGSELTGRSEEEWCME
jgi:hypothetical protein